MVSIAHIPIAPVTGRRVFFPIPCTLRAGWLRTVRRVVIETGNRIGQRGQTWGEVAIIMVACQNAGTSATDITVYVALKWRDVAIGFILSGPDGAQKAGGIPPKPDS